MENNYCKWLKDGICINDQSAFKDATCGFERREYCRFMEAGKPMVSIFGKNKKEIAKEVKMLREAVENPCLTFQNKLVSISMFMEIVEKLLEVDHE